MGLVPICVWKVVREGKELSGTEVWVRGRVVVGCRGGGQARSDEIRGFGAGGI